MERKPLVGITADLTQIGAHAFAYGRRQIRRRDRRRRGRRSLMVLPALGERQSTAD
ncbi:hypothetical protein BURCENK562V_C0002, partial [Burkholderia cenocepacia K56-2Valvano]